MESHRQVTQHHYDLHAQQQQQKTTAQVLRERQEGPAAPLKKFHNEIKRRLIYRFGYQAEALIDYACGRGGDIQKWDAAQIGYVLGLDISGAEIQEAQRRFGELKAKRGSGSRLQAEFQQIDSLAAEHFEAPRQFDVSTCMFAMHYFFDKPEALKTLLGSIAANLKPGGFFIGCVPDGKRVKAHLAKSGGLLEQPHLRLKAISKPPFEAFGATYVMEIPDTVVEGHQGFTQGSEEYMVFEKVLLAEAGKAGLFPVLEYGDAAVDALFQQADEKKAMKHFAPKYPEGSDASLSTASEIYMAFVFQKVPSPGEAQAPPLPPPERKEAGGVRAGGGGRGGFGAGGGQQRQQGGRGGGNDKMSSIMWNLPYAANYLPPQNMPIAYHNVRPGGLQQRSEAGRWIIWPPPMPAFPGPVQFTEDGREVLQHLPNKHPVRMYGQELDYWRQQQEQQQQQHGMPLPPQQPPQHQQQHGHGGMGQASNGVQQQGQAQLPQPPAEPSGGAAAGGGGRGARGGRGGGRKGAGAAAAAAGDSDDTPQAGGRGRGRGGGRGSRGGRTAGSKRDRPAEAEAAGQQDTAGGEGDAAADEQHTPAAKKQAVEAGAPAAAPNGGNAAAAAAAEDQEAAAAAVADSVAADASAPAAATPAAQAAAAAPVSRAPQSADAKLARVKAADPLEYKERQEPAPLSADFLEAMIQQAPPYADS